MRRCGSTGSAAIRSLVPVHGGVPALHRNGRRRCSAPSPSTTNQCDARSENGGRCELDGSDSSHAAPSSRLTGAVGRVEGRSAVSVHVGRPGKCTPGAAAGDLDRVDGRVDVGARSGDRQGGQNKCRHDETRRKEAGGDPRRSSGSTCSDPGHCSHRRCTGGDPDGGHREVHSWTIDEYSYSGSVSEVWTRNVR